MPVRPDTLWIVGERSHPYAVALLLAAGSGTRLGGGPKGFRPLAGLPMLAHSLRAMSAAPSVDAVVLVVRRDLVEDAADLLETAWPEGAGTVAAGGATRQESVWNGLQALGPGTDVVICHDAARPLASSQLFERVVAGVTQPAEAPGAPRADGCVPVLPSHDTVKRISQGLVVETVPREEIGLVQTPQAFRASALTNAHRRARAEGFDAATDDAMLLERAGLVVRVVPGEPWNFKVTTPEDLERAERLLASLASAEGRPSPVHP